MAPWKALLQETWERAVVLTNFACFYNVFTNYVMEVTMHVSASLDKLQAGDVVVAKSPTNPRLMVCKRLLGLEGDSITVLPVHASDRVRHVRIPKGHVWLQGDNRYNSTDSRHYGPVPYALIRGKVFYKIWPPKDWGPVENNLK
eukprot:jgi/Mesen1/7032/ME000366S06242